MLKIFVFILSLGSMIFSQWGADVRITFEPSSKYSCLNNSKYISANGPFIHVTWMDDRDGNWEIYYKKSSNSGTNWSVDSRLTNNIGFSGFPCISVSGSLIHVVWTNDIDGNAELYYKRSTDAGTTWMNETRLTNSNGFSGFSSLVSNGLFVHLVWVDDRDGNQEIYYKRSTNGGVTWDIDVRLTNNSYESAYPSIDSFDDKLHLTWRDDRDGNYEIYYKRSTDGGFSWGADTRLTNNSGISELPSLATTGSAIHVSWIDSRDGNFEIYYKTSSDGGVTWGIDTRLTNDIGISAFPRIVASGSLVHVVWVDTRDGNEEIYYKSSSNGGLNWSTDTRLTNEPNISDLPSITISGSILHVVWQDLRDGNEELYYKRNPTGNTTPMHSISSNIPAEFKLYQNSPNPFNPVTMIEFDIPKSSYVTIKIYDVLGREVSKPVQQQLEAGRYMLKFDASALSSGTYFYRIEASEFTDVKKMVVVR